MMHVGVHHRRIFVLALLALGCSEGSRPGRTVSSAWWQGGPPDELPQMLNEALPFQYPVVEYMRQIQGNVLLRLFVDSLGVIVADSTRIEQPSGVSALDSAALAGAPRLRFRPARRGGSAIAVAMLFPVHFRHPGAPPLPDEFSATPSSRPPSVHGNYTDR